MFFNLLILYFAHRIVAPKREKLEAALKSLGQKEEELTEAVAQLQKLHEELERLQQMYDAKMKEKEDLIRLVVFPDRTKIICTGNVQAKGRLPNLVL